MDEWWLWPLLILLGLTAGTLAAVSGFGGAAIQMPVLVALFGVKEAVPILTVAQLIGNGSRVWFNRQELDWRVASWFALGAVPAAFAGSLLFAVARVSWLTRLLGAFLLLVVAWRRLDPRAERRRMPLRAFAPLGASSSFLSALTGSVGPLMAPFFLAHGLSKGTYIGTEALCTLIMHVVKLTVYGGAALIDLEGLGFGFGLGFVLLAGSYLGKRIVDRVSKRLFTLLVELTLVAAGIHFLFFQ